MSDVCCVRFSSPFVVAVLLMSVECIYSPDFLYRAKNLRVYTHLLAKRKANALELAGGDPQVDLVIKCAF